MMYRAIYLIYFIVCLISVHTYGSHPGKPFSRYSHPTAHFLLKSAFFHPAASIGITGTVNEFVPSVFLPERKWLNPFPEYLPGEEESEETRRNDKTETSKPTPSDPDSFPEQTTVYSASHGGDDDPPPSGNDKDKDPRRDFCDDTRSESEDEIKITLESTSPLTFKIVISKHRLSGVRDALNTPWIDLVPRSGGSPVRLGLFFGKPVAPNTDYRVYPLVRTHQPVEIIRVNEHLVISKDKIPSTASSDPELALLLINSALTTWINNDIDSTAGFTHPLDSVPQVSEEISVTLTNEPGQTGQVSHSHYFAFTEENAEFQAHSPLTHPDQILDHMMKEHAEIEEIDDVATALEAYLANSQPVEGCDDCAFCFATIDAYRNWRKRWNQATVSDSELTFYLQIHFHSRSE